jgi:hypothetical protein
MRRRFIYPLLMLTALLLSIAINAFLGPMANGQIESVPVPNAAEACVDRDDHFAAGGAELIATETLDGADYYLIYTYEDSEESRQYPSALLVSSSSPNTCETALWNTMGDYLKYADFVPYEVAVRFREIEYSIQLERLGREDFINAFTSPEDLDLFPEFLEAFERLGVLEDIENHLGM